MSEQPSVIEAAKASGASEWNEAISCGDVLDRFPCARCGAKSPSECRTKLTSGQVGAARDFINGYGITAARALLTQVLPQ